MGKLIDTQALIIENVENYVKNEKKSINTIVVNRYLQRSKYEHALAVRDVEHYLGNPINAYSLIKRQTTELDYLETLMGNSAAYKRNESVKYPSMDDLQGAIIGLLRIQVVYQLNVTELANGTLRGDYSQGRKSFLENVTPMSASDCYELGRANYSDNNNKRNIVWLTEALYKHNTLEYDASNLTKFDIMYYIGFMYMAISDVKNGMIWARKLMKILQNSKHITKYSNSERYRSMIKELVNSAEDITANKTVTNSKGFPPVKVYGDKVVRLCQGDTNDNINDRSLKCTYAGARLHPFLMLARVKTEFLNTMPLVLLFHDVISNSEIQVLQQLAKPMMERSTVGEYSALVKQSRVSQGAWIEDSSSDDVTRVSRRVGHLTSFSQKWVEPFSVNNYGIGGHYQLHADYFQNSSSVLGDRLATVLFYLSEVEQGGATIFSRLGLTVFPKKGAALFWINLLPSGDGDLDTLHAACPVIRGSKWVANKWIREVNQNMSIEINN